MFNTKSMRVAMILCGVAAVLLLVPAESNGFFGCLFGTCGGCGSCGPRAAYSAPVAPMSYAPAFNPGCAPCATQTCRYVPQTSYRTVYRRVPVTTCRTITGCDPCTGCPTTTYRPVTSWAFRRQLVPYTTYRLVYSNPCGTTGSAFGRVFGVSSSGCSSCQVTPPSSSIPYSGTVQPRLDATPAPSTFKVDPTTPTETEALKPTPQEETQLNPAPSLIGPANRTTSRPVRQATHFRLISSPVNPVDDGGWRASSD